ncbi:MAG: type II 3-dehydroquinate dehydratase [Candidatus Hydrogenedentes bacterium]|jgi:3-dehydroquinate dehydratase-2|nr:type II 3-dehydroquinate dehydratase [Candidatus Hydrogenedentota bacterium]
MRVLVIHGPNLNLLGTREPEVYGNVTLSEINERLQERAQELGIQIEAFHSNHEGEIVDKIAEAASTTDAIIINPAAYTHTSVAIRDAISAVALPTVEVHLSNTQAREKFRHTSVIAPVVTGQIAGFGADSYLLALQAVALLLDRK